MGAQTKGRNMMTVGDAIYRLNCLGDVGVFILEHDDGAKWNANVLTPTMVGQTDALVIAYDQTQPVLKRSDLVTLLAAYDSALPFYVTTPNDTEPVAYVTQQHLVQNGEIDVWIEISHL
jgi:hypothetical protein